MKKIIKALFNMVVPSLLFYVVYRLWGILPAIIVSAVFAVGNLVVSALRGKVKNTQVLGLLGLIGSFVAIYFTGEEKYYYVPSLLMNVIFLGFMVWLCLRRKSVFHYIAKDFEVAALEAVPEERLMSVNFLWIVFFCLKILAKILGLLYLNFKALYWLVFLFGDPLTIVVIVLSVVMIRNEMKKPQDNEIKEPQSEEGSE